MAHTIRTFSIVESIFGLTGDTDADDRARAVICTVIDAAKHATRRDQVVALDPGELQRTIDCLRTALALSEEAQRSAPPLSLKEQQEIAECDAHSAHQEERLAAECKDAFRYGMQKAIQQHLPGIRVAVDTSTGEPLYHFHDVAEALGEQPEAVAAMVGEANLVRIGTGNGEN